MKKFAALTTLSQEKKERVIATWLHIFANLRHTWLVAMFIADVFTPRGLHSQIPSLVGLTVSH